jgi:hypothetical protein
MLSTSVNAVDVVQVVQAFDRKFREMECVLWRLSRECRAELLGDGSSLYLEELVCLVADWMAIQGYHPLIKSIGARALKSLPWTAGSFDPTSEYSVDGERAAREQVRRLVERMMDEGAGRREYSLASKVLHWLTPWRVPVYDKFMRVAIGITGEGESAYYEVVGWEYSVLRRLLRESTDWIGDAVPLSPLRALDKYLWWKGGGSSSRAKIVNDPWAAVRHIGLGPD